MRVASVERALLEYVVKHRMIHFVLCNIVQLLTPTEVLDLLTTTSCCFVFMEVLTHTSSVHSKASRWKLASRQALSNQARYEVTLA